MSETTQDRSPSTEATLPGFVPWPPEFAETYRRKGYWKGRTLGQELDDWAQRYGERIAVVSGEERVSYRELKSRAENVAVGLAALGIGPRDRVVIQLNNVPEFFYVLFGLFKLGALPVLALPAHRETEIRYLLEFSEAVAYCSPRSFRDFDYVDMVEAIAPQLPKLKHLLVVGAEVPPGTVSIGAMARAKPQNAAEVLAPLSPKASDVAFFLLSGGTTGLPKMIPRTHDDYSYNFTSSAAMCGLTADSVYLIALPISHNFPLCAPGSLGSFSVGAKVVLAPSPSPEVAFPIVERERVTVIGHVPAVTIQWLDSPLRGQYDLSSLEVLQVGGSRLNDEVARRVRPLLGAMVQQTFGMAEGFICCTRLDDSEDVLCSTQGRPMTEADEVLVVGWDGEPVAPGQTGELLTRGPYTIRGYYKAPEHNAKAFTANGFYRTGDVVRMLPSGNFTVEGRVKDLINRGGEKIAAEELENLILAHASVHNVAVVAMPDPILGEKICAYVVCRPGQTLTLEALRAFLDAAKIARFKLPERLELIDALPLTSVGKISKKQLREDVAAKLRTEGKMA